MDGRVAASGAKSRDDEVERCDVYEQHNGGVCAWLGSYVLPAVTHVVENDMVGRARVTPSMVARKKNYDI